MSNLPSILKQGERSRLFPVLAETSKEGRTLSILLSCIENVHELGKVLLADLGVRIGPRAKVETYTEVVFHKRIENRALRPDGLIVVQTGSKQWTALIEAKVGKNDLTAEQVEGYLEIAKQSGIDALITISNQFAPLPTHHPVPVSANSRKKATLFHWSWKHILTTAKLLLDNREVGDADQQILLNEMLRFLSHDSAGVRSFDQMPSSWSDLLAVVQAGGSVAANNSDTKEVIGAWHQESQDLSLILSRQLARNVEIKVPRSHRHDPLARAKADAQTLCTDKKLQTTLSVPDAASPIEVIVDLQTRSIAISMKLKAPSDKISTKARLNWLLKQIANSDDKNLYVRLFWPGRGPYSQFSVKQLREDAPIVDEKKSNTVTSFEVVMVKDCGARLGQRRNFIVDLENAVPDFYEQAGQYLRNWQAPAPKLKEEKSDPKNVDTRSMQKEAELKAFERHDISDVDRGMDAQSD
ncbi:hypothetical protein FMN50_21470 [Rhodobacterales bacterium]|nr:hypothetical protein FMN50_21470 [Rhodobacterales bacterium]